jgi:Heme/copper-type cytochrome/quinol oxidases, subunit 2
VLVKNEQTTSQELVVRVTGEQFEWTFRYPNGVVTHELVLEKGRPTEFAITSLLHDVIHSFYVPQFRVKADAVPGLMNYTYATRPGSAVRADLHRAVRPGHSLMRAPVQVMEPADFTQWLATQKSEQSKGGA